MATRVTVTLEEDQYLALSNIAEENAKGLSDVLRETVARYLAECAWAGKDNIGDTAIS
ncbi:MAG: hypothetical protein JKX88_10140 [Marinicaulis sp.]|nr:hypothetical protein [Marinicaulis sp.]